MKKAKLRELLREREKAELEVTEEQVQQIADAIVGVATNEGKPVDELVNEMIDDTPETSSEEVVQAVAEAIVIQADEDGKTVEEVVNEIVEELKEDAKEQENASNSKEDASVQEDEQQTEPERLDTDVNAAETLQTTAENTVEVGSDN